jgi:hypothetical protein
MFASFLCSTAVLARRVRRQQASTEAKITENRPGVNDKFKLFFQADYMLK